MNPSSIMEFNNVNGFKLSLMVDASNGYPKSRKFTIAYKTEKNKRTWSKTSLFLSILINIVAFCYIRISIVTFGYIFIVIASIVFFWVTHSVQTETLLVIPTVGIQTTVKFVWGKEDRFIPWDCIDDVFINEVIKMNQVLYFLSVLVKPNTESNPEDKVKLVSIFQNTKPRLMMIEKVYSELKSLLIETISKESSDAAGDKG